MLYKQPVALRDLIAAMTGSHTSPLWVVPAWILGSLLLGQVAQLAGEWLIFGIPAQWALIGIIAILLIALYLGSRWYYNHRTQPVIEMREQPPVGKAGLILLVSTVNPRKPNVDRAALGRCLEKIRTGAPNDLNQDDFTLLADSNLEPPLRAIEFHQSAGTLRDCWLIATLDSIQNDRVVEEGSKGVPLVLERWFTLLHPGHSVRFHHGNELCVGARDYAGLWNLVDRLFETAAYKPEHVIADVTSGTKLMSIGVALACLPPKRTMEYVAAGRDWRGEPIPAGNMLPILVDIDPYLTWSPK